MQRINDPDDPRRCQSVTGKGQCDYVSEEHSNFCIMHGGNRGAEVQKAKDLRNYRLTKFQARTSELGNNDQLTSIRDEVAILRMIIEEKVNACNDSQDLLLISGPLSDLIMKSGALVEKCQKLESKLGNHLDRTKVTQFAQMCVEIISNHVNDDVIEIVSEELLTALGEI
jgi:hypothetical protein